MDSITSAASVVAAGLAVGLAQFLLDRLELLLEIVLTLRIVDLLADIGLYLPREL